MGIVNVYGSDAASGSVDRPKALKAIGNLTTSITSLKFNHDSQLLAMASNVKKDQMRMVCAPPPPPMRTVLTAFFRFICHRSPRSPTGLHQVRRLVTSRAWTSPPAVSLWRWATTEGVSCYTISGISARCSPPF